MGGFENLDCTNRQSASRAVDDSLCKSKLFHRAFVYFVTRKRLGFLSFSERDRTTIELTWIEPFSEWRIDWLIWVVSGREHLKNAKHEKYRIENEWKWMNENEWKREDEIEIGEEMHTTRYLKHLRPLQRGLLLRCWSLLQASCLLSPSFAFGCGLLRETPSSSLSPACASPFTLECWGWCFAQWSAHPA